MAKKQAQTHSKHYQLAYNCYVIRKTWSKAMLTRFYQNENITQAEYEEILAAAGE